MKSTLSPILGSISLAVRLPSFFLFCLVSWNGIAQRNDLNPTDVLKLMPGKVKGFHVQSNSKSKEIQLGTLTYSVSEKSFAHGVQEIKFLVFDYNKASVMYNQSLDIWKAYPTIHSDSIMSEPIAIAGGVGWQSYQKKSGIGKIVLALHDRFILNINSQDVEPAALRAIFDQIPFADFPKKTTPR